MMDSYRFHAFTDLISELLTSGSSNFEFDNQFFGHIPNHLTMCTVENRSMYGV